MCAGCCALLVTDEALCCDTVVLDSCTFSLAHVGNVTHLHTFVHVDRNQHILTLKAYNADIVRARAYTWNSCHTHRFWPPLLY